MLILSTVIQMQRFFHQNMNRALHIYTEKIPIKLLGYKSQNIMRCFFPVITSSLFRFYLFIIKTNQYLT